MLQPIDVTEHSKLARVWFSNLSKSLSVLKMWRPLLELICYRTTKWTDIILKKVAFPRVRWHALLLFNFNHRRFHLCFRVSSPSRDFSFFRVFMRAPASCCPFHNHLLCKSAPLYRDLLSSKPCDLTTGNRQAPRKVLFSF